MELPFKDIPKECQILGAFAAIKALDEEGRVCWFHRYDQNLSNQEAMGQMTLMIHRLIKECDESFLQDEE